MDWEIEHTDGGYAADFRLSVGEETPTPPYHGAPLFIPTSSPRAPAVPAHRRTKTQTRLLSACRTTGGENAPAKPLTRLQETRRSLLGGRSSRCYASKSVFLRRFCAWGLTLPPPFPAGKHVRPDVARSWNFLNRMTFIHTCPRKLAPRAYRNTYQRC